MSDFNTSIVTQIASSITSITIAPANLNRFALSVYNDSTVDLYIKFGAVASLNSFTVKIPPSGFFEIPQPCYRGQIDGIWTEADGNAYVTEIIL